MVLCYTNYCLIHITFHYTLHISIYIYIFICFYTYIFIFFYGFLTANSRLALQFSLQLPLSTVTSYSCLPTVGSYGWLYDFLYVFLYGCLYGYLITVFSSFILYILCYLIFIFLIHIHCILNTIFYYILNFSSP
jgi:hypothetical protein